MATIPNILQTIERYRSFGIDQQIDYKKFYLYSIITHSTAIEGSTVTEIENQLLFDEGITAPGRTLQEQMMNLDLKAAYEEAQRLADRHMPYSIDMLCRLSAIVMKNTGSTYNTPLGSFSAAEGELRKVNVTAGFGGRSYLAHEKVPQALSDFCRWLNTERAALPKNDTLAAYRLSFVAHFRLVSIHPWADGNGRMSRLVMNMLQFEYGLIPAKVLKEQKAEYIQALNDTRDQQDESIFPNVMLRLHNSNLQSEIDAFVASQEADTNLTSLQANITGPNDNLTRLKAHDLTGVKEAILAFCAEWHSVTEIAQHVHRSKQYVRGEVLPLIKDQLEMLYPDNTSHPKQKYRVKTK